MGNKKQDLVAPLCRKDVRMVVDPMHRYNKRRTVRAAVIHEVSDKMNNGYFLLSGLFLGSRHGKTREAGAAGEELTE